MLLPPAYHRGAGPNEQGDPVEQTLGPDLLHHIDRGIDQHDPGGERRIARPPQDDQGHAEHDEHRVDHREEIGA